MGHLRTRCRLWSSILVTATLVLLFFSRHHSSSIQHSTLEQSAFLERRNLCPSESSCRFALVADPDTLSRISFDPPKFRSFIISGELVRIPSTKDFMVRWAPFPVSVYSSLNEGGRGLELSDLIIYKGQLLSFDDRTGIVFQYTEDGQLIPKHILTEGDGLVSPKGMKIEWATEKDGKLWVGSFGKEFTDPSGAIVSEANLWVATVDEFGHIGRHNWTDNYNAIRNAVKVPYPGYVLHEAINWSSALQKWILLPRRVSGEVYDDLKDEDRGANLIILASEDFSTITFHTIKSRLQPKQGFSAFRFVPGSKDRVILAVKSKEDSQANEMSSCITVIETLTGEVLVSDVEVPHETKYEGVEFIPQNAKHFPFLNWAAAKPLE